MVDVSKQYRNRINLASEASQRYSRRAQIFIERPLNIIPMVDTRYRLSHEKLSGR